MLNQSERDTLSDVIKNLINNNEMFTAFDVTSIMRNKHGLNVYHSDVKNEVHNLFNTDSVFPTDYTRKFRVVDANKGAKAHVYYPQWEDVSKYDSKKWGDTVDGPFDCDSRGRNCVRAKWIKKIATNSNNAVFVEKGKDQITLSVKVNPNGKLYYVDRHWNVRVSNGFKKFKIKSYKDCIVLVKA